METLRTLLPYLDWAAGAGVGVLAYATLAAMIGSLITHARRSLPTEPLAINSAPGAAIEFEDDPHE